ncbi:MAG: FlgD immunoglobulin-like domain containing protein [Candidatus Eisenbacteria bacterium]
MFPRPSVTALVLLAAATALLAPAAQAYQIVQVTDDGYLNYMPSLIERQDGTLMIVYERLDSNYENGDIMVTFSDDGSSWATPLAVVATAGNERHPALVQLAGGSYQVYYLSDEAGGYRIHVASSADGLVWTRDGVVDLGWTTENLVNPTVCLEDDGSLTMSYDVLSNGGYVAHSGDGLQWDHNRTNVSTGSLNRVMRHSDGTYVLSYQRKTGIYYYQIDIFTKTSTDRVNWSPENRVTYTQNSHDSFPAELADGQHALYYATSTGGDPYDLFSVVSPDGSGWHSEESWLAYVGWDTEPHPVRLESGVVAMAWPRGSTQTNMQVHVALLDPPTEIVEYGDATADVLGDSVHGVPALRSWPNPFSRSTSLSLTSPAGGQVTFTESAGVAVCDVAGRIVRRLVVPEGAAAVAWDGRDSDGRLLPSGIYFARLDGDVRAGAARLVLLR